MVNVNKTRGAGYLDNAGVFKRFVLDLPDAPWVAPWADDGGMKLSFRVLAFDVGSESARYAIRLVNGRTAPVRGSGLHAFVFEGRVLCLAWAPSADKLSISHKSIREWVVEFLGKPFGIAVGLSQIFTDLDNADLAYRQACTAIDNRIAFNGAYRRCGDQNLCDEFVVSYNLMLEMLLIHGQVPQDLLDFTLGTGLVRELVEQESQSGVSEADLVFTFLLSGCNARKAAERLFMHRNTVAYHIKCIEKRFGISFDDPLVRGRMRMGCLYVLGEG